ncbi:MAG: fluoride efflux transporter CrcB, partial [Verrucomicrobiota bacterium]
MIKILLVGFGGFVGSVARYLLIRVVDKSSINASIPLGTFLVNLIGCFLLGLFIAFLDVKNVSDELKDFVRFGLLGGFTTYSAFAAESMHLIKTTGFATVLAYIG